jgi:hypothetical protein
VVAQHPAELSDEASRDELAELATALDPDEVPSLSPPSEPARAVRGALAPRASSLSQPVGCPDKLSFSALRPEHRPRPRVGFPDVAMLGSQGDLATSVRAEYELLRARVEQQREQADRLRAMADALEERTTADEHLLTEMAGALGLAAQLQIEDLSPRLRGQRLQEVALEVLRTEWGAQREIHYREWFDLVRDQGHRIGGKDPLATFLAQIHRAPQVRSVGRRSGRYQLDA